MRGKTNGAMQATPRCPVPKMMVTFGPAAANGQLKVDEAVLLLDAKASPELVVPGGARRKRYRLDVGRRTEGMPPE